MMQRTITLIAMLTMAAMLVACGGDKGIEVSETPGEKLLWKSEDNRPGWTINNPETEDDQLYFVGVSDTMATEQLGISRAMMNARTSVVQYMGTLAKNKIEQARVDFGLATDVVNPTSSAREYTKQLSTNFVSKVKRQKTYIEKWQTETGIGYRVWTLCSVPIETIEGTYAATAANQAAEAARKAKERNDQIAKQQLEKASDMWEKMKEEGLFED